MQVKKKEARGGTQQDKKQTRGGHRPGAGRPKADYQTTTVSFRVRTEWAADIKKAVKEMINTLKGINQ